MVFVIITACKKKKESQAPTPIPVSSVVSLKIDGVEKKCSNACYSGSTSGGLRGAYFYLAGFDEFLYFSCTTLPAPGTYTLVKYKNPFLTYSKNNVYRPASTGVLNVTSIDTSANGVINSLVATFSFKTDTSSSGTYYNMTEGIFNLKK